MKAIEFISSIHNGVITIPQQYSDLNDVPAKVIVLIDDLVKQSKSKAMLKKLMIEGYKNTLNEDKELMHDFEAIDLENWD